MTIPAGWYPDPEREGAQRWWDGESWAPSQDDGAPSAASWQSTEPSWQSTAPHDWEVPTVAVPTPSWESAGTQTSEGASWQSADTAAYQSADTASWQSASPPTKTSLGLILGLAGGGLALVLAAVIVIGLIVTNLPQPQQQEQQAGGTNAPIATFPATVDVDVPANGEQVLQLEIAEAGVYSIAVDPTNGEDPVLTLTLPSGEELRDDDGGAAHYASLLTESLDPGNYEIGVTEFGGDHLTARVTVTQDAVYEELAPITSFPASAEVIIPPDAEALQQIEVSESALYTISLTTTNDEDGYLTLRMPDGDSIVDDDSGGSLNPEIVTVLEPGTYTLAMSEYGGDPYTGVLSIDMAVIEEVDPIDSVPASVDVSIAQDLSQPIEITIDEAGSYEISVVSTNGEDPRIELTSETGESWSDDDGGDGLDSLLEVDLEQGTYELVVEEFSGDPLTATIEITQAD